MQVSELGLPVALLLASVSSTLAVPLGANTPTLPGDLSARDQQLQVSCLHNRYGLKASWSKGIDSKCPISLQPLLRDPDHYPTPAEQARTRQRMHELAPWYMKWLV